MVEPGPAQVASSSFNVHTIRSALGWLVHPVTVTATALLVLNDHLLKAAYPGTLTGKLSDVAGLVMAPPVVALVLAVLLPRVRAACHAGAAIGLVTVGFAAVKSSPAVAGWASAAWSVLNGPSVVRADPMDLLAVPASALAWLAWQHAGNRPAPVGLLRLVAVLIVLPTAGLAIAATSAPYYPDAVSVGEWRGMAVVGIGNAYHKGNRAAEYYRASSDGGATFHYLTDADDRAGAAASPARTSGCSVNAPLHCFRVVAGHLEVEETSDGGATWRMAWRVSDAERARLSSAYPKLGDITVYLASRSLVVQDQASGGVIVLVANGRDGFARRDATGHWARIGFGVQVGSDYAITDTPAPIPPATPRTVLASVPMPIAVALIAATAAVFLCCAVATLRQRRRWPVAAGLGPWCLGALVLAATGANDPFKVLGVLLWTAGAGLLLAGVLTIVSAVLAVRVLAVRGVALAVLIALAIGGAVLVPFVTEHVWSWPTHTPAIWLAAAVVVAGGLAAAGLGVRYSRPPTPVAGSASPPPAWSPSSSPPVPPVPRVPAIPAVPAVPAGPAVAAGPARRATPAPGATPRLRPATPTGATTADQRSERPSAPAP